MLDVHLLPFPRELSYNTPMNVSFHRRLLSVAFVLLCGSAWAEDPAPAERRAPERFRGSGYDVIFRARKHVRVRMHKPFERRPGPLAQKPGKPLPEPSGWLPTDRPVPRRLQAPTVVTKLPDNEHLDDSPLGELPEVNDRVAGEDVRLEPSWGWLADEVFEAERAARENVRQRRVNRDGELWQQVFRPSGLPGAAKGQPGK
jgi:hypothetical protein